MLFLADIHVPVTQSRFVFPQQLDEIVRKDHPGMVATSGEYIAPHTYEPVDIEWNHLDHNHRPFIHNTYKDSITLSVQETIAHRLSSVKAVTWLPFRAILLVAEVVLGSGRFYQGMTLWGFFYIHIFIEVRKTNILIEWRILSSKWLKWFHPYISNRLKRLNQIQNAEDEPIRKRRDDLRKAGFRFKAEPPNFINANSMTPNLIEPGYMRSEESFSLAGLGVGETRVLQLDEFRGIIVKHESQDRYRVWPRVCPHEGADLAEAKLCSNGRERTCSWHGLRIAGIEVNADQPRGRLGRLEVNLVAGMIRVRVVGEKSLEGGALGLVVPTSCGSELHSSH